MGPKLYAARYDEPRDSLFETYFQLANLRVRCALPGWLQRMEVTVKFHSRSRAYDVYKGALGHGFALYDSYMERPIVDGWIYEIAQDGRFVTFIVGNKRLSDEYVTGKPTPSTDTGSYVQNLITNNAPAISTDFTNVDTTGTSVGDSFSPPDTPVKGRLVSDIIPEILEMGTSSDEVLDFWMQAQPFDGVVLQKPIAYLKARSTSAAIDWQVQLRDLSDVSYSRNLWEMANDVLVVYTRNTLLNGAHSKGVTTLTVDDSTGFGDGVEIEVELNNDRRLRTTVDSVPSGTSLTITDDLPHTAPDDGYVWLRNPPANTASETDTTSQSSYWTREYREEQLGFDLAQARQYRGATLSELKDPKQEASFTIGSRYVRDGNGARWPTWRMLHAPGYIRINDLFPEASLLNLSLDSLRAFFTVAMDYDHESGRLSVTPDAYFGQKRLDVILQQLGAPIGQGVRV